VELQGRPESNAEGSRPACHEAVEDSQEKALNQLVGEFFCLRSLELDI
jgi:hypothetical protein